MKILLTALLGIALSVAAQFVLKGGMSSPDIQQALVKPLSAHTLWLVLTNKLVLAGFACYGFGAAVWLGVLAHWDVSKAYPLVGLGFCLTLVVGALAGEEVSQTRIAGVFLICLGVVLVARS